MAEKAEQKIEIEAGMRVKVEVPREDGIPITTMGGRDGTTLFYRQKTSKKTGKFLFGAVEWMKEGTALIRWDGPKYRTSVLPLKLLILTHHPNNPKT